MPRFAKDLYRSCNGNSSLYHALLRLHSSPYNITAHNMGTISQLKFDYGKNLTVRLLSAIGYSDSLISYYFALLEG